jgi:hypothetical protein
VEGGDDGGISGGGGQAGPSSALSDYEQQRLDNIRQNEERLRTLGLLPLAPAARPTPAPRQPRPPRPPGVPSRASDRQRGKAQKSYSEAQGDQDLEDLLASDSEDDGSSQEPDELAANEGGPPAR